VEITTIDAQMLANCFLAGAKRLEANKDYINELNVFPVPDGDTGTNMTMTIMSAAQEVSQVTEPDLKSVCKAMSSGSLRGARGNSGVILSQLLRGFTKVIKKEDTITVDILCEAFQNSCETAYKAVMKPKEGTILTVARAAADKALEMADSTDDILVFAKEVVDEADRVLQETPEMLPVLKQAGVVDSGGQGLLEVLRGAYDILSGKEVDLSISSQDSKGEEEVSSEKEYSFLYQTNFIIKPSKNFSDHEEGDLKNYLDTIGEDAVISHKDDLVYVTCGTNDPGHVLTKGLKYGAICNVSIVNLRDDKEGPKLEKALSKEKEKQQKAEEKVLGPHKEVGFVAVSIGKGLNQLFADLGADYIIQGGQTMNPSTDDILKAIEQVNADTVFVLPNNKNIVLAANQAVSLCEDKRIIVLPTKTIPQGIAALIHYMPGDSVEENEKNMTKEFNAISSGEITYAVRDTVIDDKEIHEGDYMGIGDSGILSVSKDITETMILMLHEMVKEDSSLICIYTGEDTKKRDAKKIVSKINEEFPDIEVELSEGGQPVYYYVLSVE